MNKRENKIKILKRKCWVGKGNRERAREGREQAQTDLNLAAVQVDDKHAMSAHRFDHSGDGSGRDGHARLGLAVLTCVAKIRHHRRDALG